MAGRPATATTPASTASDAQGRARAARSLKRAVSDEDKQQRRAEILGAAKRIFAEHGYHEATMADVARGTGLSYGVVYWYFASKDELFHALMADEEAALRATIQEALRQRRPDTDDLGMLRLAVRATFSFLAEDPASAQLVFQGPRALGEPFERHLFGIFERFIDDLEGLVTRAQAEGLVRDVPARTVAVTCAGLIAQLALRRIRTDDGMSSDEAADFVVDVLVDGLRPRAAGLTEPPGPPAARSATAARPRPAASRGRPPARGSRS